MNGDREAVRALLKQGARRQRGAGRRHDGAALGGEAGDAEHGAACCVVRRRQRAARRRGSAATRRCTWPRSAGYADVVKALVAGGADAKAHDDTGTTPLMMAAGSGDTRRSTALLDSGATSNARETERRPDAR